VTDHEIEEYSGGPGTSVYDALARRPSLLTNRSGSLWAHAVVCRRCSRGAVGAGRNPLSHKKEASDDAWTTFLRGVPWDCDVSVVASVMSQ
jgi:hypothetical protein